MVRSWLRVFFAISYSVSLRAYRSRPSHAPAGNVVRQVVFGGACEWAFNCVQIVSGALVARGWAEPNGGSNKHFLTQAALNNTQFENKQFLNKQF